MERRQEWEACQEAAKAALTAPDGGVQHDSEPRLSVSETLRLWRWPSFESWNTWVVLRSHSGLTGKQRLFARRLRWRLELDSERLHLPMIGVREGFHSAPTIEVADANLVATDLDSRVADLEKIGLGSIAKPNIAVVDGTEMGFMIPRHLELIWSIALVPTGWELMADWVERQMDWLDSLMDPRKDDAP